MAGVPLSLSQVGPSHISQGGLDAEGRFWRSGGFWVFNCGVQGVVGLQNQVWQAGLGASSLRESLVCSPPHAQGESPLCHSKTPQIMKEELFKEDSFYNLYYFYFILYYYVSLY